MAKEPRERPRIEQLQEELVDGKREHESRCRAYDRCYDIYRAVPPKGLKRKPWESRMRVKYALQTIDTALVNLVGGVPKAKVRPKREQDVASAEAMEGALGHHVAVDHFGEKQSPFAQQSLIYGVTAAKNHYLFRDRTIQRREWYENPYGPPIPIEVEERVTLRDGPTFEPWDVYDVWWEPNARDVDSAAYIAFRSWLSKDELRKNVRSDDRPFGLFDARAVDELLKAGASGGVGRTSAQERFIGGTSTKRKDRFEIVEVWRDETLTIMGEDQVVLCHKPNPYWAAFKPGVIVQQRPDVFEMVGIAETELIEDLQDALNSLQNMRMDNLHMTVMRGFTYRDTGLINPAEIELKPRFKWPVADHDDIRAVEMQPLPPESYREDEKIMAQMQLITGINPYISGADLSSVDQNTATGVTALTEVASRLMKFKARQIVGDHDLAIEGVEESLSRQTERAEAIALLNAFAPLVQVGGFSLRPVL